MHTWGGEAYRKIQLCVDSYGDGVMKGRYYMKTGGREFDSIVQFLTDVESVLDTINFPQAYTAKRSFSSSPSPVVGSSPGPGPRRGAVGTFELRILFRQHTSWQGSVTWVEENREQTFRSVLELILLIDGALGGCRRQPSSDRGPESVGA